MNRRTILTSIIALLLLGATACGTTASGAETGDASGTPVAAPPTDPADPGSADDEFPAEPARQLARGVLGMNESDLPDDVRISRRGDEHMMLTEDYVLGRLTVELDDDGSGHRVVSVTVELPDGPETFELEAS